MSFAPSASQGMAPFGGSLGYALGASLALHVAMMLSLGGAWLMPSSQRTAPVMTVLSLAAGLDAPAPSASLLEVAAPEIPAQSEASERPGQPAARQGILFDARRYYRSNELDVRARPLSMASAPRAERAQIARQLVAYKLELFINELGAIDRIEVLEPEGADAVSLPEDIRELRFHPAQRGGVAVPSRKLIELSFVP